MYSSPNPKARAAAEAIAKFKAATAERRRAVILAMPDGEPAIDVTEHVVSLLDMITGTQDWGSEFWDDSDLVSFTELCKLLKFDESAQPSTSTSG